MLKQQDGFGVVIAPPPQLPTRTQEFEGCATGATFSEPLCRVLESVRQYRTIFFRAAKSILRSATSCPGLKFSSSSQRNRAVFRLSRCETVSQSGCSLAPADRNRIPRLRETPPVVRANSVAH